jgi:hypothetical protein
MATSATSATSRLPRSSSLVPSTRVSLAILLLVVIFSGAAVGIGGAYALTRDSGPSGAMCQDALHRRQQTEAALTRPPQAAGNADAQVLANVKWDEARRDAQRLTESAQADVRKYCS